MKVIVTGANGFIGSSLIRKLIANHIQVLAIDISFACNHLPESDDICFREMSADDLSSLEGSIGYGEYELFYHLAWKGVNGPDKGNINAQIENIETSLKCAQIAKKIGCKKILFAGTIAEESVKSLPSLNKTGASLFYGVAKDCSHKLIEAYCKNNQIGFVWMQFSNIYGPQNKTGNLVSYTLTQLKRNQAAEFGPANQPYDFIYVDDLIEAVYRLGVSQTNQCFYFIGSGTPAILSDYLKTIGVTLGKPDLIKIGVREDDGIRYTFDMFRTDSLKDEIGEYVTEPFEKRLQYTSDRFEVSQ